MRALFIEARSGAGAVFETGEPDVVAALGGDTGSGLCKPNRDYASQYDGGDVASPIRVSRLTAFALAMNSGAVMGDALPLRRGA